MNKRTTTSPAASASETPSSKPINICQPNCTPIHNLLHNNNNNKSLNNKMPDMPDSVFSNAIPATTNSQHQQQQQSSPKWLNRRNWRSPLAGLSRHEQSLTPISINNAKNNNLSSSPRPNRNMPEERPAPVEHLREKRTSPHQYSALPPHSSTRQEMLPMQFSSSPPPPTFPQQQQQQPSPHYYRSTEADLESKYREAQNRITMERMRIREEQSFYPH